LKSGQVGNFLSSKKKKKEKKKKKKRKRKKKRHIFILNNLKKKYLLNPYIFWRGSILIGWANIKCYIKVKFQLIIKLGKKIKK
jgi:hypothetical protein